MTQPTEGMNVLALLKDDGERFVFLYDDESSCRMVRLLCEYASNPDLNFTWYDAATLSQRVRRVPEHPED